MVNFFQRLNAVRMDGYVKALLVALALVLYIVALLITAKLGYDSTPTAAVVGIVGMIAVFAIFFYIYTRQAPQR